MEFLLDNIGALSDGELLAAYHKARRLLAERKFARDTERGRVGWQGARLFVTGRGGVTERQMAVEASDDMAKKVQHIRAMTLDLDLLKADVDVLVMALRCRGAAQRHEMELPHFEPPDQDGFARPAACDKLAS